MTLRIVVADDSYLIRQAVCGLVEDEGDLEVVGTAADLPGLLAVVAEQRPDVVVTDVRMPPTSQDEGVQAARHLRSAAPEVAVVVLSQHVSSSYATELFDGGSSGRAYLLKDRIADAGQLAEAIRTTAAGGSVVDPLVVEALVQERRRGSSPLDRLTPREREVLTEMARGRNNAGIARSLTLTERAVAKHINAIFTKLDLGEEGAVHRRVQAVLLFIARG